MAIVGAGAAGLMTAIHARTGAHADVLLLDGARAPGAKILVSGGSRCNVTNTVVTERDYWGGRRTIVRRILRAFPIADTVALHASARVNAVTREGPSFRVETSRGSVAARFVVLATGGLSLPKTGSDGGGYEIARSLGHTIVPATPGLAPLVLAEAGPSAIHRDLAGVSHEVELSIWIDGAVGVTLTGALLWTHFGISGPVVLNASRHWARATLEGRAVQVTASFYPGRSFDRIDEQWVDRARIRPTATIRSTLASDVPAAVSDAVLKSLSFDANQVLATLSRDDRRRLVHALIGWPFAVRDTRGYNYAEVTAGGVELTEIDPASMASRACPGLFLVGEILDVDGRLGGFNFQWAWATGKVAGTAITLAVSVQ